MKKILLVNPWIEDVSAYDYWLKPLGLLYISSILKHVGIESILVDCLDRYDDELVAFSPRFGEKYYGTGKFLESEIPKPRSIASIPRRFKRFGFPEEVLRNKLREVRDVVGVFVTSMMTYWHYGVNDTIRIIRDEMPSVPVVLGGVYATLLPEHARRYSGADKVCPGTGVEPLKKALNFLKIDRTLDFDWFDELDPDYSVYKASRYAVLISSLGCPFKCTYCASNLLWNSFVRRDPIKTARFVKHLASSKELSDIVFFDDAILIGSGFKKLMEEIERLGIKVRFHLPNGVHARFLDREIADLMYENNFKTIKLGLETSDKALQNSTGGKVSLDDIFMAVENLSAAGFTSREISAYIMINLPGQSEEDVLTSLRICEELRISPSLNEFTPIPGTLQWKELTIRGVFEKDIDPLLLDNSILPHWWKEGFSAEAVQRLKEKAWSLRRKLND
ncbi:MAG: radical SAM protein [Kosmotogaceae bacterium]|nr:radical SAM protein [Kosmotogaceae bacterium]